MADIRIGTIRSRTDITPEGEFQDYKEVEFFVDDARHTLRIPEEKFSAKVAEEEVKKKAAEILQIQGKKIAL